MLERGTHNCVSRFFCLDAIGCRYPLIPLTTQYYVRNGLLLVFDCVTVDEKNPRTYNRFENRML